MTIHTESSIPLKDATKMKRDLQELIRKALNTFYEETGLSVDSISVDPVVIRGVNPTVKHVVSLEVKL